MSSKAELDGAFLHISCSSADSYRRRNLLEMRSLCFSLPSTTVSAAETSSQANVLRKQDHIKMRCETSPKVVSWVFGGLFCIYLALCDAFTKMRLYLLTRPTLVIFVLTQLLKENCLTHFVFLWAPFPSL